MLGLNRRGDTLVEVMLAAALLSAILFSCWALTNKASQISLAARQRVSIVDALKEQAEILNAYYADNPDNVSAGKIISGSDSYTASSVSVSSIAANPCNSNRSNSFYFNKEAKPVAGVESSEQFSPDINIWIQRVSVGAGDDAIKNGDQRTSGYNDFYIQACWLSLAGTNQKQDNSKLIVRLNK